MNRQNDRQGKAFSWTGIGRLVDRYKYTIFMYYIYIDIDRMTDRVRLRGGKIQGNWLTGMQTVEQVSADWWTGLARLLVKYMQVGRQDKGG
jgi:hypothetical protein